MVPSLGVHDGVGVLSCDVEGDDGEGVVVLSCDAVVDDDEEGVDDGEEGVDDGEEGVGATCDVVEDDDGEEEGMDVGALSHLEACVEGNIHSVDMVDPANHSLA